MRSTCPHNVRSCPCAPLLFLIQPVFSGILKNNYTFCVSTLFAVSGSLLLLIGASIWTVVVRKTEIINEFPLTTRSSGVIPLGITMSSGPAIGLLWGAFATLLLSVVPYMIS